MRISIIAAMARNRIIGRENGLPWHLPEDLRHFKRLTMGHHILMGRKTFESIGKPLPGRTSIVITRNRNYASQGVHCAASIEAALASCKGDDEIFFIGGAELYQQAIAYAERLYLTEIKKDFEGDARFPEYDKTLWHEISRESHVSAGGLEYDFVICEKKGA